MTEENTKPNTKHCDLCPDCGRGVCQVEHHTRRYSHTIIYHCKKQEENIKSEEWEERFERFYDCDVVFRSVAAMDSVKGFIRSTLASQRHHLKQQVLEAIGKDDPDTVSYDQERNQVRMEIRQRIEDVFAGEEV